MGFVWERGKGYRTILAERRGALSEQCNKLRNGLTKLEEAREQARYPELLAPRP